MNTNEEAIEIIEEFLSKYKNPNIVEFDLIQDENYPGSNWGARKNIRETIKLLESEHIICSEGKKPKTYLTLPQSEDVLADNLTPEEEAEVESS
mgnify:CR=1 FL=1